MKPDLEPCPFCGCKAELVSNVGSDGFYIIRCMSGHSISGVSGDAALVEEWNSRPNAEKQLRITT